MVMPHCRHAALELLRYSHAEASCFDSEGKDILFYFLVNQKQTTPYNITSSEDTTCRPSKTVPGEQQ
jgi:hypothetical protein